jgi:hypothetical protein
MTSAEVVERHRTAGREFAAAGVRSFVRDEGRAAGLDEIHTLPARHFPQEDQAPAVAEHVARLALR